jgi:hypothetical protein
MPKLNKGSDEEWVYENRTTLLKELSVLSLHRLIQLVSLTGSKAAAREYRKRVAGAVGQSVAARSVTFSWQ